MKFCQYTWSNDGHWVGGPDVPDGASTVVIFFGERSHFENPAALEHISLRYPKSTLLGCSSCSQISKQEVLEGRAVAASIHFERSRVKTVSVPARNNRPMDAVAAELVQALRADDLAHVFLLSDGIRVDGANLTRALERTLPAGVGLSGGMAGDCANFERTYVCTKGRIAREEVVALGLYGRDLDVRVGVGAGWIPFGPERIVTAARGNELFELDGQSALGLYRKYLGRLADDLPASGLRFPLGLREAPDSELLVRTVTAINEATQSMTFAGGVALNATARLMKANFSQLVDGASSAARRVMESSGQGPQFVLCVSCVGRKWLLRQMVEDEVDAVARTFGPDSGLVGFYSYGEFGPYAQRRCALHNQSMNITAISERVQ